MLRPAPTMESICPTCRLLADSLHLYEQSLAKKTSYSQPLDFLLGSCDDVQRRSTATGCASCRSIMLSTDHLPNNTLTAHFFPEQPRVVIIAGELDGREATRRERLDLGKLGEELRVSYFLTTKNVTPHEPHARLIDARHVDMKLVESWINRCDVSHEKTCRRPYDTYLLPKAPLSFIDVYNLCVVTPPPPANDNEPAPRYIALSYVWGTVEVQRALKENIAQLRRPGAFGVGGGYVLPRTVRDAIELTAELGVQYLWVDSVCIVQDDEEGQKEQLRGMGAVYANAYLTIVATSGTDADAGINRVGSSSRSNAETEPVQRIVSLPGNPLVRTQDGKTLGRGTLDSPNIKWNTRGWTLQEKVFSRRLLGLGDVATWTCFGDEWTEDISLPSESTGPFLPADNDDRKKTGIVTWPSINEYSILAAEYATRDLTWSVDAINAFLGVMTPMAQWFPGGVLYGIAEYTFDIGLLWDVGSLGAHLRRDASAARPLDAQATKHPTWSWVSWTGDLRFDAWKAAEDYSFPRGPMTISPLAKWHKQLLTGDWVGVDNTYHVVRKHFQRKDTSIPPDWTQHQNDRGQVYYENKMHGHVVPQPSFNYPIPPHTRYRDIDQRPFHPHIRFQGQLARVSVHIPGDDQAFLGSKLCESDAALETDLMSPSGSWCGRVTLTFEKGDSMPPSLQVGEVIAISEGVLDLKTPSDIPHVFQKVKEMPVFKGAEVYQFVNVLWIGRFANGMVYRKALGQVWKQAWGELGTEDVELLLR